MQRTTLFSLVLFVVVGVGIALSQPASQEAENVPQPASQEARKVFQLDPDRTLVLSVAPVDPKCLPELFLPETPLRGARVVPPTRLSVLTAVLQTNGQPDVPLYSRIVQEYEPHLTGYATLEARFQNGGGLIILAKGPGPMFSVTRVGPSAGYAQVAGLSIYDFYPESKNYPNLPSTAMEWFEARLVGSAAEESLAVEITRVGEAPAKPLRYMLSASGEPLTLKQRETPASNRSETPTR
jgi:hypothetical protein